MKKTRLFKLIAAIALLAESLALLTVVIVLSIQKKSIPKAVIAVLAAGSVLSACLLISCKKDGGRIKKLCETDAFYDYDYDMYDEDYDFDIEESELLPGAGDDE